jgi:hypothetical protein
MRAGSYAEFEGRVFEIVPPDSGSIRLLLPKSETQPPGFEPYRQWWTKLVERSDVSRLFTVETTAVWRGLPVIVARTDGSSALIRYFGGGHGPVEELPMVQGGDREGGVPIDELTSVVEVYHELAI